MTKSELVEAVAQTRGIIKNRAELAVSYIFDAMFAALERGEGVELWGGSEYLSSDLGISFRGLSTQLTPIA